MPATERRVQRGEHHGRYLLQTLARELRSARLGAGISQRRLAREVGVSGVHVSRIERAAVPGVSMLLLARMFAVLGQRLSARPYPEGPPLRDIAHIRLISRLQVELSPPLRFRTEVPLGRDNDQRAWDGEVFDAGGSCKVEAETALHDVQATDRRIALKMADDDVVRVLLLVAESRRNRRALREFRHLVSARYPLGHGTVMRELRAGRLPERGGVVVL
jgi:transcriptional regulator with XRE-family HTH domain